MRISPLSFDLSAALNSHNWLKQFSQASIKRAQRYARGSALTTLSMQCLEQNALTLTAQVQGTARRPYRTRVEIFGIGDRFGYICDCSCPVEVDCKHAAAVLIAASSMSVADWTVLANRSGPAKSAAPRRKTAPPAPAPPAWRQWLGSLGPPEPKIATASVSAPTRSLAVLLDAVTYRQPGQMIASLVWVRPTLAGRLGNIEQVRLRGFANDLESGEIDDAWHDRIARLQVGEPQPRAGHWFALTGRHGEWLLEDLLRSGAPCFWQKPTNGELRRGEDRTLDWCWTAATNGEQTLQSGATSTTPLIAVNGLWQWDPGSRCLHRLTGETTDLAAALLRLPPLPPEQAAGLAEAWRVHPRLSALPAPRVFAAGPPLREPPVPVLRLLQLPMNPGYGAGEDEQVRHLPCVRLEFDYAGQRLDGPASAGLVTRIDGDSLQRIERQFLAEQAAQAALHDVAGPIDQRHDLRWQLRDPPHPADYIPVSARGPGDALIVLQHVTALQAQGFRLEFDPNFPLSLSAPPDDWFLDVTESETGNAWFEAELGIDIDGERISLLPILQRALSDRTLALQPAPGEPADAAWYAPLDKVRHIALPLSQVRALLAPLMQWLGDGERLRIPRVCAGVLDELSEIEQLRLHTRTAKAITALATQLREGGSGKRIPLPRTLKAELRPYQRDGLDWLGFLGRANLGGVLADDMGLGKTVQVLAHLLAEKQARRLPRPALIVVPTSVIGNWREQAKRFAPSLRVLVLHGGDRHFHFQSLDNCDVAITTYALLPRDRECLRREHFSLAVFDEAQALKNPRSKAAIVARELNASRRLVVTGTPLENHLGDLWAQFDCVLPGLLGDSKAFTRHFRTPIEKHADPERQARLNRQVAPFLLRRSKEQVAPELPSKTEVVQTLELTGKQRALYETLRLAMHDKVQKAIAKRGLGQSSIIILDALLKLRQVCCDPRLVNLDAARTLTSSAKLDALLPMLEELLAEGRRILLFSQFTQMLDLIEDELRARKLPWLRLDGSTRDRDTPVQRFQAGDCPLFLVSLKAGGVGLNLTAADTVIHFDPWWNPAVERQATDRAHRIGQDKPVFVYKLICAGTVEEKIQAMQQRKAALAEAVLSGGSRHSLRFDEDDIAALFAPLADPAP